MLASGKPLYLSMWCLMQGTAEAHQLQVGRGAGLADDPPVADLDAPAGTVHVHAATVH